MTNKKTIAGLREQIRVMSSIMEAFPDKHMRFGRMRPDGTYEEPTECADWCYACQLDKLRDAVRTARALHQPIAGDGGPYCQTCTQDERQPEPIGWWVPMPCPTVEALDAVHITD